MAMLPAPMDGGGLNWGKRHMTSNEGSAFLRMAIGAEKSASRRISTHSLKSTSISWCSKFGVDEGTKALLARHLSAIKNPQALYSRDLLSPVLRAYDQVLAAIRTGMFQPDRTRSGMVCLSEAHLKQYGMVSTTLGIPATPVYQADQPVPATPVPVTPCAPAPLQAGVAAEGSTVDVKSEPFEVLGDLISVHSSPTFDQEEEEIEPVVRDGDCWSESSESSCEESSSEEEGTEAQSPSQTQLMPRLGMPDSGWYINSKSLVLHCLRNATTFRCGRPVTVHYIKVRELNGFRCGRCFNV